MRDIRSTTGRHSRSAARDQGDAPLGARPDRPFPRGRAPGVDPRTIRTATTVRLDTHRVSLDDRAEELERLLAAISGEHEATPPTVPELLGRIPSDVLEAASRAGAVTRIAPDLVVAPALVDRAMAIVRAHADTGVTVSALRSELGTSRRFAVPLLGWLDRQGRTVRRGDLRFPR